MLPQKVPMTLQVSWTKPQEVGAVKKVLMGTVTVSELPVYKT